MKVEQVYQIANSLTQEYIGETEVLMEDLSNIVDIGKATIGLANLDKYVNSLIDHIGKVVFVNRPYSGKTPSLMMDGWEFGAILEKISYDGLPEAQENLSWELEDGVSYDPNIFTKPSVSAKFFSKKVTFDIPMSFAERQVKMAFDNPQQLNAFFSMIYNAIEKSMTVKMDSLAQRALNNMIGITLNSANPMRAVNLLAKYKAATGNNTLTADKAIYDPEFIRFTSLLLKLYAERMQRLSKLFNDSGKERFTSPDMLHVILLSEFAAAAEAYLQSDTYHNEFVSLPKAETVPYWQGSGTGYAFNSTSKIDVTVNTGVTPLPIVQQTGILGVMFDHYAVGVANLDRRVTSNYNGRAEFYNNWYKFDAGYFNDPDENFVVFYVADQN